jgi:hypothetical protein
MMRRDDAGRVLCAYGEVEEALQTQTSPAGFFSKTRSVRAFDRPENHTRSRFANFILRHRLRQKAPGQCGCRHLLQQEYRIYVGDGSGRPARCVHAARMTHEASTFLSGHTPAHLCPVTPCPALLPTGEN